MPPSLPTHTARNTPSAARAAPAPSPRRPGAGFLGDRAPLPQADTAPPVTAESLLESARRQIREESRQRARALFPAPAADPLEAPPGPLARAMSKKRQEEKMLPGGILRVTTAAGTVFCLQTPPRFAENSLTESLAVPVTCP